MGVPKSTTWSKTYKMWALLRFKAVWLRVTLQRVSERTSSLQERCTHEQTPWQWASRRSASPSPSPGWHRAARSLKSSPSSRRRLRPPPCAPTCPSGQRSDALAWCTPLKSGCTFRRQRRTRRSAGWWSCAWWCSGRSTPRSPARRRRWPTLAARPVTSRLSPLSQRRRRTTFTPEPSSSLVPASMAAHLATRWPRPSPALRPRRRRRAASTSSRAAAPGRALWLCWCTTDLAPTTRTVPHLPGFELATKSGMIPEQPQASTDASCAAQPRRSADGSLPAAPGESGGGQPGPETTVNNSNLKLELENTWTFSSVWQNKPHKPNALIRQWKNLSYIV